MIDFGRYEVLSFDCYGTLIDWETGILNTLRPVLDEHGVTTTFDQVLEVYAEVESDIEAGVYVPYRSVLRRVICRMADRFGFSPSIGDLNCLVDMLGDWPPFEDTVESLKKLKNRYRLAIISNIDDDLFAETNRTLDVAFDHIITAAQVGAYKPSRDVFNYAIKVMGVPEERLLHVAQSIYHDHVPARELGISTVWINRRSGKGGSGATPPAVARPNAEFPDLASMVREMNL